MLKSKIIRGVILAALMAGPCFAGEVAVLKNGFTIEHQWREVVGDVTRLYTSADGSNFIDVPTDDIEHFEAAPDAPVPVMAMSPAGAPPSGSAKLSSAPGFPGRPKTDLSQVVNQASGRYRLDPDLVNSVIQAESAFNARAVSPKGARGLMQLMPGTASQLGVPNAFSIREANVGRRDRSLRELLEHYNFDLVKALAAYNAGPQRVERFWRSLLLTVRHGPTWQRLCGILIRRKRLGKGCQRKDQCSCQEWRHKKSSAPAKTSVNSVAQAKTSGASE